MTLKEATHTLYERLTGEVGWGVISTIGHTVGVPEEEIQVLAKPLWPVYKNLGYDPASGADFLWEGYVVRFIECGKFKPCSDD